MKSAGIHTGFNLSIQVRREGAPSLYHYDMRAVSLAGDSQTIRLPRAFLTCMIPWSQGGAHTAQMHIHPFPIQPSHACMDACMQAVLKALQEIGQALSGRERLSAQVECLHGTCSADANDEATGLR